MPDILLKTRIKAPVSRVFDLARSIELHLKSAGSSNEQVVAGRTSGLLELGEEITWEGSHFGLRNSLSVRITELERPVQFTDEMVEGAFSSMRHIHTFQESGEFTLMEETFQYRSRGGPLGWLLENSFLTAHLRRFLAERNKVIKEIAEGDGWKEFLPAAE